MITAGLKWYEYTIAIIGFIITLVWGNVEPLVMIFPVIGGAIGGFVFAAVVMVCIAFALKMKNPIARLLLVITGSVGGFVACGIVGYIFVFLIAAL
ncbi:MAG: hypothetical protein J6B34_03495 [Clostridia bacterium]|nr:hypothetical protein [Clostridia bacterium]